MRTEAERQYYLQHAGVRLWYARAPLPGAAPSPNFDFAVPKPELSDNTIIPDTPAKLKTERSSRPVDRERSKGRINQLQALMAKPQCVTDQTEGVQAPAVDDETAAPVAFDGDERAAPELREPLSVSEDSPSAAIIERCCIQAWIGQRIVIVAHLSEQSSLSMQETLARNILKSLGDDLSDTVGPVHWPLFNNLRVGLNSAAHLQSVIKTLLAPHADKALVSLGDTDDLISAALGKAVDVRFASGLAVLAGDSSLKRQLWQQIKPLSVFR